VIFKARDWIEQKQLFRLTCDLGKIQIAYRLSVLDYPRWWGHGELFWRDDVGKQASFLPAPLRLALFLASNSPFFMDPLVDGTN
jgi:hypothetical protein